MNPSIRYTIDTYLLWRLTLSLRLLIVWFKFDGIFWVNLFLRIVRSNHCYLSFHSLCCIYILIKNVRLFPSFLRSYYINTIYHFNIHLFIFYSQYSLNLKSNTLYPCLSMIIHATNKQSQPAYMNATFATVPSPLTTSFSPVSIPSRICICQISVHVSSGIYINSTHRRQF